MFLGRKNVLNYFERLAKNLKNILKYEKNQVQYNNNDHRFVSFFAYPNERMQK